MIRIVNPLGQFMISQRLTESQSRIDVSQWPEGAYYLLIESNGVVLTRQQVIVAH